MTGEPVTGTEPTVAEPDAPGGTGVGGRSVGRVTLAILAGSALGYAVVILTGRLLDKPDYVVFMTFWGLLFGLGSALSPLEQELSRQSAVAKTHGGKLGSNAVTALVVGLVAVGVAGAVTLVPGVNTRLFGDDYWLGAVVLVGGLAFAVQFAVRGLLVGDNQVDPYAGLIIVEAAVRPVVMVALVVAALHSTLTLAVAAGVGSFAWLLFGRRAGARVDRHLPGDPSGAVVRRMLMLFSSAALTASVVTGYPAMVGLLAPGGDPDRLGSLYAALAVARIPLLLFAAVQALAVPVVVRMSSTPEGLRRLRKVLAVGTLGAVGLAGLGAVVGLLIGPWAVRFMLGAKYDVAGWVVAGLVWSSVLIAVVQLLAAVLVARVRPGAVLLAWAVVSVTSAVVLVVGPGDHVARAVLGLVVGPTLGVLVAAVLVARSEPSVVERMPA
ncbi:hypothetical protein V5P93_000151 [Actinokineospora auranticolor]|uniref:O-antigen/teichoic acid export membrane protein n=1 Tax=Actinokineospora auranticolor TaxID=155976 RepID=A0A2S6GL65_9PSEU|nr:hypothetical protein [Actinokineospora auranticolor]PPK65955.1 hypothetical protein CLV40_112223 [Actinokineospora auranticolor]